MMYHVSHRDDPLEGIYGPVFSANDIFTSSFEPGNVLWVTEDDKAPREVGRWVLEESKGEAVFVRNPERQGKDRVLLLDATIVTFWCPGCEEYHGCETKISNKPSWTWDGDLQQPSLSPSVHVRPRGPKKCHSVVRDGRISFLSDSHHALAGQTVDLPECED